MNSNYIRPLVICLFRINNKILVAECFDPSANYYFYRPLGGAIKFGELSEDALRREILEEIGENIRDLNYLGTLENIFTFNNELGHEIVLVYDGKFVNQEIYTKEWISGCEGEDGNLPFMSVWKSLEYFQEPDSSPLYPDGLLQLIFNTREGS
jgi:8-oxo-dGTP pyrophosphatase MutT (NUDIX family)